MGDYRINTDGIWWLSRIGLLVSAIIAIATIAMISYVIYQGIMAIYNG